MHARWKFGRPMNTTPVSIFTHNNFYTLHHLTQVHDPPLNHIGLWVDALPEAVDWLTAQGVRFTPGGIRTGAAGHDVVFIHPKSKPDAGLPYSGQGVLIELVQATPEVIAAKAK